MTTSTRISPSSDRHATIADGISELRQRLKQAAAPLLTPANRIALLEYPSHPNVGDSAIWLGEIAFLSDHLNKEPVLTGDIDSYSKERLSAMRNLDAILLHGGGNLGDLWDGSLDAKTRVLNDFPDICTIQLPQTIYFQDPSRFDDYRRAVAKHRRFTLLVRDQSSFDIAAAKLDCEVRLCPDMALWLDLRRAAPPQHDVVCLLRTDIEANGQQHWQEATKHADILVFDWLNDSDHFAIRLEQTLTRAMLLYPRRLAILEGSLTTRIRNWAARDRLQRGCALLSSGKAVVTDRLHGHILCVLLGIPHVVLDNSYGKVSRFCQAWTTDLPNVRFAQSLDEAVETARSLAAAVD